MNPENGIRILEILNTKKVPKIQLLRGKIAHPILAASAPSIRDRHERRATRVRCALRALRAPPPFKKKRREFFGGVFFGGDLLPRPRSSSRNLPSRCSRLGKIHGLGPFEWEFPNLGE